MEIEEGCLAMVINSQNGNNGKTVKVIKRLGKIFEGSDMVYWKCDKKLQTSSVKTGLPSGYRNYAPEYQLMRIDGFNENSDVIETSMLHD